MHDSDDEMDDLAEEDEKYESEFPISDALQDLMASGYESESDDDSDTELTKMEPILPDASSIWTKDKVDLIRKVTPFILTAQMPATNTEDFLGAYRIYRSRFRTELYGSWRQW